MDFLTDIAKDAVVKLGDLIVKSTVKHFQYVVQHKKIIANLEEEHTKLKGMKEALQGSVDAEIRKGHKIARNVQKWLDDVAGIEGEIQFLNNVNEVSKNKKCFHGKCPNLAFNYSLGKRATNITERITSLKEEEKDLLQTIISYPKPPAPFTVEEGIMSLKSRAKIIEDVMGKLESDEIKRISICGMGGVGKTTLVKELIQIVEKSKQFHEVVMATVSQNPNYEKIQSQIIDGLGLKLESAGMEGKARELRQRLMEKSGKVLIVLDDVWDELKFELIGIPSIDHQKGIKIIFTSRDEKVCEKMESQKIFQVSVLSEDEAWSLFREMAGNVVDEHDINPIAQEVAEECGGLPLAIATIGRTLKVEKKDGWTILRDQLKNSQVSSFKEMQECVYSRIKLSFNFLRNEQRECCFLLCGLFPEDFDIPVECLFRFGVGMGLFEALDTMWNARIQVNYWVENLKRCFLLLDSDKPGCVKMHDLVRDVALEVASTKELGTTFVHNDLDLKRMKKGKWCRMSLVLDEMTKVENILECPTLSLELLHVRSMKKNTKVPWLQKFIQGMSKLQVLALQNLCIPQIPSQLQALANLQMLHVEGCDVGDISVIGKELQKLEILSFAYSNIKQLPIEIGQLRFLRILDLTRCDNLNFISSNVLANLSLLEELYFRVENFPWMLNEAFVKELGAISQQLKVLEIRVRNTKVLHGNFNFKNLEKFWVYMIPGRIYEEHCDQGCLASNLIQLKETNCNFIKNSKLAKKCEILILEKMKDLKNVIYELDDNGLQCLIDLRVDSCPNLGYIIDPNTHSSEHHEINKSTIRFSYLLKLELRRLPNFTGFSNSIDLNELHQPILHGSIHSTNLADSTNVDDGEALYKSHSKTNAKLFSFNWMENFPRLEKILLDDCNSLEMVFDLQGYSQSNGSALVFPQLKIIEISYLNNLKFIWGNVPKGIVGFQSLRSLKISDCDSLTHVFTSAIIRAIMNLEILNVSSCKLIKNIVVMDSEEDNNKCKGEVENILVSKLRCVSLSSLPQLVKICSHYSVLKWSSLIQFEISKSISNKSS